MLFKTTEMVTKFERLSALIPKLENMIGNFLPFLHFIGACKQNAGIETIR